MVDFLNSTDITRIQNHGIEQGTPLGIELGKAIGLEKGIQLGIIQGKEKILSLALPKLIQKGYILDEIAKIFQYPLQEIFKIQVPIEAALLLNQNISRVKK